LFEISDDCFDKGEDDVVGIEDVNVCCGLAEFDTSDGRGLRHGLRPVRNERLLDDVDKLFLSNMFRRAINILMKPICHVVKHHLFACLKNALEEMMKQDP
jgi:hypothetical protein